MHYNPMSAMGYELRKSAEVRDAAIEKYKELAKRGFNPNDCFDIVFSTIDGEYSDLTDEDKRILVDTVDNFCSLIDRY